MAKIVAELPTVRRGRPEKYPYKQWFNGRKWELQEGTSEEVEAGKADFDIDPASFKAALYARKKTLGYVIQTRTVLDPKTGLTKIYVQRLTGAAAKSRQTKAPGRKVKTAA